MKNILSIFVLFAIWGCSSSQIQTPGKDKFGPIDQKRTDGVIEYNQSGLDWLVKKRRNDAYKTMFENCGEKYKILAEKVIKKDPEKLIDFDYRRIKYKCLNE